MKVVLSGFIDSTRSKIYTAAIPMTMKSISPDMEYFPNLRSSLSSILLSIDSLRFMIIQCNNYILSDGLSYQISQIINDLNKIYIQFKTFYFQNSSYYNLSMSENIINIMIQNNFFIRFYLNDIFVTYYESYTDKVNNFIQVVHIKFYIFIFILFASIICYRFIFVKHIKKKLNNLSRIKVFFDDYTFEILE